MFTYAAMSTMSLGGSLVYPNTGVAYAPVRIKMTEFQRSTVIAHSGPRVGMVQPFFWTVGLPPFLTLAITQTRNVLASLQMRLQILLFQY